MDLPQECWPADQAIPDAIYTGNRTDLYGSMAIEWVPAIALSWLLNKPLYHNCMHQTKNVNGRTVSVCKPYLNNVFHEMLVDLSRPITASGLDSMKKTEKVITNPQFYFFSPRSLAWLLHNTQLKPKLFSYFSQKAKARKWDKPFNPQTALVIHVRLMGNAKKLGDDLSAESQRFYGERRFQSLLRQAQNRYPNHEIYIVTNRFMPESVARLNELIIMSGVSATIVGSTNPLGTTLEGSRDSSIKESLSKSTSDSKNFVFPVLSDMDYDLWLMMIADVLILSNSNFSLCAGLLHQGSSLFLESWFASWPTLFMNFSSFCKYQESLKLESPPHPSHFISDPSLGKMW